MSAERWMNPEAKALLELERAWEEPPKEVTAAVLSRLDSALNPEVPSIRVSELAAPAAVGALSKLLASGAIFFLGAGFGVGMTLWLRKPEVQVQTLVKEIPVPVPATAPPVQAEPKKAFRRPKPEQAPALELARPVVRDSLSEERSLLELARTALTRGGHKVALETLEQHAKKFPKGQLAEERDSLWIQVLANGDQRAQARERAMAFKKDYPGSILLPAVDLVLQSAR